MLILKCHEFSDFQPANPLSQNIKLSGCSTYTLQEDVQVRCSLSVIDEGDDDDGKGGDSYIDSYLLDDFDRFKPIKESKEDWKHNWPSALRSMEVLYCDQCGG